MVPLCKPLTIVLISDNMTTHIANMLIYMSLATALNFEDASHIIQRMTGEPLFIIIGERNQFHKEEILGLRS